MRRSSQLSVKGAKVKAPRRRVNIIICEVNSSGYALLSVAVLSILFVSILSCMGNISLPVSILSFMQTRLSQLSHSVYSPCNTATYCYFYSYSCSYLFFYLYFFQVHGAPLGKGDLEAVKTHFGFDTNQVLVFYSMYHLRWANRCWLFGNLHHRAL